MMIYSIYPTCALCQERITAKRAISNPPHKVVICETCIREAVEILDKDDET